MVPPSTLPISCFISGRVNPQENIRAAITVRHTRGIGLLPHRPPSIGPSACCGPFMQPTRRYRRPNVFLALRPIEDKKIQAFYRRQAPSPERTSSNQAASAVHSSGVDDRMLLYICAVPCWSSWNKTGIFIALLELAPRSHNTPCPLDVLEIDAAEGSFPCLHRLDHALDGMPAAISMSRHRWPANFLNHAPALHHGFEPTCRYAKPQHYAYVGDHPRPDWPGVSAPLRRWLCGYFGAGRGYPGANSVIARSRWLQALGSPGSRFYRAAAPVIPSAAERDLQNKTTWSPPRAFFRPELRAEAGLHSNRSFCSQIEPECEARIDHLVATIRERPVNRD